MKFGLSDQTIEMLQTTFRSHPEVTRVQIFGSRALGNFRDNSDIDLALWDNIDEKLLATLMAKLDDLPLPYQFDLQVYSAITHQPLREHIAKFGKDIYVKEK